MNQFHYLICCFFKARGQCFISWVNRIISTNQLLLRNTFILFLLTLLHCSAQNKDDRIQYVEHTNKALPIQYSLFQLPDPKSEISFSQVQKIPASFWRSVPSVNFGISGGTGWAFIPFSSHYKQTISLELQTHFIDSLTVWLVSSAGIVKQYPTTGFWHLADRKHNPWQHRYYLFDLALEENQSYRIYIKGYVIPGITLKYAVQFWQPTQLINEFRQMHWGWALFVGIIGMASALAFINFVLHPRPIYLYYIGYIFFMSLYALANDGWGIFFPTLIYQRINAINLGLLIILGVYCLLLFSRHFLSISAQASHWWLRWHPGWYALVPLTLAGLSEYGYTHHHLLFIQIGYQANVVVGILVAGLWLSYVTYAIRQRFQPAWLLLCSQLVMLGFYAVNLFLVNTGLIKEAFPDMVMFRIALVVDLLIITFGLTYRQKVIRESQQRLEAANALQQQTILEVESKRQAEEIRALRLQTELQSQRERLARDLHDGIGSQLSHIISRLDLFTYTGAGLPQLQRLVAFVQEMNQQLRETLWVLNQKNVTLSDLASRLRNSLLQNWGDRDLPVLCWEGPQSVDPTELSPVLAINLLRITQEAVNNALKYAAANYIQVQLVMQQNSLVLLIADDGKGFDSSLLSGGYGLGNIRKRAEELQGNFLLKTGPSGTQIEIIIPNCC